jgi:hypothetical protein
MKSVWKGVVAIFVLGFLPGLFDGDPAWYMTIYCQSLRLSLVAAIAYELTPKNRVGLKTTCLVFSIYTALEAQFYFVFIFFDYNVYSWSYVIFAILISALYLYNRYKQFQFKSDPIKKDNIYLCFWKPKTGITITASLIGLPFGGLCVYANGNLYGYRWGIETYQKSKRDPETISRCFTVIDTGISCEKYTRHLDSLVGNPAGRPRIRCISTIKPVLNSLGGKYRIRSLLDLIPSIYSIRILKWKKTHV